MSRFGRLFSRLAGRSSSAARPRPRVRLKLEGLEERTLLNNRFVVPLSLTADNVTTFYTLQSALTTNGLNAGDIIQIEPGSSPGNISDSDLSTAKNDAGGGTGALTIRGSLSVAAAELPVIGLTNAISIAGPNLRLENLNIQMLGGNLTVPTGANDTSIINCLITNNFSLLAAEGVIQLQSQRTTIRGSTITSYAGAIASDVIQVSATNNSNNVISNNVVSSPGIATQNLLTYVGGALSTGDLVVGNQFFGDTGVASILLIDASNVTVRNNFFRDADNSQNAIDISSGTQNNTIRDNDIVLTGASSTTGIAVQSGAAGSTTSTAIVGNRISTSGNGSGIRFGPGSGGTFTARVEGNDFHFNAIGVNILAGGGASVANLDLGGGSQSSLGGNNFRSFTGAATTTSGAIVVSAATAAGPINAQMNLFGIATPETVIFDQNDNGALANVVATGNLTGNAAYVQALYLEFLHRAGDTTSAMDAGNWVTMLNNGTPFSNVVNAVARSAEALGLVVDRLYRQFLNREADAGGRANFVMGLQNGGTVESVIVALVNSAEYKLYFGSDGAFVKSLYIKLLNRVASDAEVAGWVNSIPSIGRTGVANGFVISVEFRELTARRYYAQILNRLNPSQGEVNGWVFSGLDLLTIAVGFANSPEFQANG